jgi:hypothetical protein
MKKILLYSVLLFTTLLSTSCEKVVDIDLENSEPKLVIDAIIKWQKGTSGENQTIKLSLTNDFYTNNIIPANGATVTVTNSSNVVFNFVEVSTTGDYVCTNFQPIIGEVYRLEILYQGAVYSASSALIATPDIINVEQVISGEDEIEIKFFYQDNGAEENYYLGCIKNPNKQIPEFGVVSDEFFQGNVITYLYVDSETEPGITLDLSVQGVSKSYYNYMNKLITIAGSGSGNPFATPPATVRGNITNTTNNSDYPLGYFHLSEIDTVNYLVE